MIALAMVACGGGTTGTDSGPATADTGTDSGSVTDTGPGDVDSGPGDVDSGTGPSAECSTYCTAVNSACSDTNRQYGATAAAASDSCLAACAGFGWAAGTTGAMDGDSLACRTYHATAAATAAAVHCPHAGPLGGGVCGASNCADFCAENLHVCTGANAAYASMDACMTACTALSDATTVTSPTTASGNTLACRMYHLTAALTDAATHCPHTAADGGGVCM